MAALEAVGVMATGDGDEEAGLADFEAAGSMEDGTILEREASGCLFGDLAHHAFGHFRVGVVFKVIHGSTEVVVANDAEEDVHRAAGGRLDGIDRLIGAENFGGNADEHGQPPETGGMSARVAPGLTGSHSFTYSSLSA